MYTLYITKQKDPHIRDEDKYLSVNEWGSIIKESPPYYQYINGNIYVINPDPKTILEMKGIASKIVGTHVVGDDGEEY